MSMQFTHTFRRSILVMVACAAGLVACGGGGGGGGSGSGSGSGGSSSAPAAPPPPPPWGSLRLTGTSDTVRTFPSIVPNKVPIHLVYAKTAIGGLFWNVDNGYEPRATLRPTGPHRLTHLLLTYDSNPSGQLVGNLGFTFDVDPELDPGTPVSFGVKCGGGVGVHAILPREAACDRITFDRARRVLRLDNVPIAGTDTVLNGELSYPDFTPRADTTATASALNACPLTVGGAAVALPPLASAACLQGNYRGVSDAGKACTVTMNTTGSEPNVSVAIDGYTANYRFFARRDYTLYPARDYMFYTAPQSRAWGYWFTMDRTDGTDPVDVTREADLSDYLLTQFTDVPNTPTATEPAQTISFFVFHRTAPTGVAGPVGIKTCVVSLR